MSKFPWILLAPWCATIACVATAGSVGGTPPAGDAPHGLTGSDWSGILAARDASRHAVSPSDGGGHRAWNPGQQWRIHFDDRGFRVTPAAGADGGDWSWGLELERYGFAGHERPVGAPMVIMPSGQRISVARDAILTEWIINDRRGVEHGFTLKERPAGGAGHLRLTLAVRGDLCPELQDDRRGVRFVNADGAAVLDYSGLTVFDADGTTMPAWFDAATDGLVLVIDEQSARYPLTIDPVAQQAYIKASNTDSDDYFGYSVAASGDTVVVGAYQEDSGASGVNGDQSSNSTVSSGAAYVFVRTDGAWSQQAYLKASNCDAIDEFGWSVAIDGDTIVVGAHNEQSNAVGVNGNQANNDLGQAGAAYVFVRNGVAWSQDAYLKASNTQAGDQFGFTVAVSGDTIAVGAIDEDSSATGVNGNQVNNGALGSGAVYVFLRGDGTWTQQAYIKASNTQSDDQFSWSLAISGDTVVVGAPREDGSSAGIDGNQASNGSSNSGAAYVFTRTGEQWSQQAYVKSSNPGTTDWFGYSVAMSGDTMVIGAPLEDSNATGVDGDQSSNSAPTSGAAYVFVRTAGAWSQQAYLKASNTEAQDRFGTSVGAGGDTIVVGAIFEDSSAAGVNGNQAGNGTIDSGAAYLFSRIAGTWSQSAYLKASNPGVDDQFGIDVAVGGDVVVCGAYREASNAVGVNGNQGSNSKPSSGAAYAFSVAPPAIGDLDDDGLVNDDDLGLLLGKWGPCAGCPADINGDGLVDGDDLGTLLGMWGPCEGCAADIDGDGMVDGADLGMLLGGWNEL